ncbi:Transposon Tf2-11 polyprotein [Sesamum angolense]|uniref:Transposon Tf2-11 polyprotein n=1 Tax=Sesamum angolense TaxID=2727404 RepID=A0AAE1W704_9LAMI|nr:Transposon Tf2-11 polyprotein [Sesamum angolense]
MSGLRADIQRKLDVLWSSSFSQVVGLAKLLEAKLNDSCLPSPSPPCIAVVGPRQPLLLAPPPPKPTFPIRRLSHTEMQEPSAHGLFFNYDGKFALGHRCKAGYHQVRVALTDVHKMEFRTIYDHFEFLVMPFGFSIAPSIFQAVMNDHFRPFLDLFVLVFFDDIFVYSKDWNSYLLHLREVLQVLSHHKFFIKISKCSFGVSSVKYLGHIISPTGLSVDPSKLQAMADWPTLHSISPLPTESAFLALKYAMLTLSTLHLPDFSLSFEVTTYVSQSAIDAVLSQQQRPIKIFCKKMSPKMQSSSTYGREMYVITKTIQTPTEQKWLTKLLGFDYGIFYTTERSNVVADTLSRHSITCLLLFLALTSATLAIIEQLRQFYASYPDGLTLSQTYKTLNPGLYLSLLNMVWHFTMGAFSFLTLLNCNLLYSGNSVAPTLVVILIHEPLTPASPHSSFAKKCSSMQILCLSLCSLPI